MRKIMSKEVQAQLGSSPAPEGNAFASEKAAILKTAPRDKQGRLLAPNGQPTTLTEDQWATVRTKNFKRWFGDWFSLETKRVLIAMQPVKVDVPELSGLTGEILRTAARAIHQSKQQTKEFLMPDGRKIAITGKGWREANSHSADARVLHIAADLQNLLGRSIFLWSEQNSDPKRANVIAFHNYGTRAIVDGRDSYIRFAIREDNNGQIHYDHDATSVEVLGAKENGETSLSYPPGRNPNAGEDTAGLAKNRLAQWWNAVNPETVSKIVDENGEPLVVFHSTSSEFDTFKEGERRMIYFNAEPTAARAAQLGGSKRMIPAFLKAVKPFNKEGNPIFYREAEAHRIGKMPESKGYLIEAARSFLDDGQQINARTLGEIYPGEDDADLEASIRVAMRQPVQRRTVETVFEATGTDVAFVSDEGGISIAVPSRTQVKSATDNNGEFSENPSFLRSSPAPEPFYSMLPKEMRAAI